MTEKFLFANVFEHDFAVGIMAALVSLILSILIVSTKKLHGHYSLDSSVGVQKFHTNPTPRIGGISVYVALVVAVFYISLPVRVILLPLLLAGSIALLAGIIEDLTKKVGVVVRLLATMASGLLAWYLTDYSLTRLDIPYIDDILKILPISVMFTAFAIGGIANAINIIDGLNGLSSMASILAFAALAIISREVGDIALAHTSMVIGFSILGFMIVNWPYGKLFLGDGGAYFIGFSLAWICILLAERQSNVSAFVAVLICIHPIAEVLFSMYRRRIRHTNLGHPDRLHLHSLFKARYINKKYNKKSKLMRNSIAGIYIGMMTLIPATLSYFVYKSTSAALGAVITMLFCYVFIYKRLINIRK